MARSSKKGPYIDEKLYKKAMIAKQTGDKKQIKTWARACVIIPDFIGLSFAVHNGKRFLSVFITEQMVGYKLGEFAPTRTFRGHGEAHTKGADELT